MKLKLELVDDAGVTFENSIEITNLDLFALQLGEVGLKLRQIIQRGEATFRPKRPGIVVAGSVPKRKG